TDLRSEAVARRLARADQARGEAAGDAEGRAGQGAARSKADGRAQEKTGEGRGENTRQEDDLAQHDAQDHHAQPRRAPRVMPLIVAIDGPAGVGKSTVSRLVARALGVPMIDTGAMYRAIGLAAVRRGIDLHDAAALEALAHGTRIDFIPGEPPRVLLDGEDVTELIRTPRISMAASHVSAVPAVRRAMVRLQQEL